MLNEYLPPKYKHKISKLRSFVRSQIQEKDFKEIVKSLAGHRKEILYLYSHASKTHEYLHGERLDTKNLSSDLNKFISETFIYAFPKQ